MAIPEKVATIRELLKVWREWALEPAELEALNELDAELDKLDAAYAAYLGRDEQ